MNGGNLAEYGLYVPSESLHLLPVFNAFRAIWPGKCTYYYQSDRHDKEREAYGWNDVHEPASVLLTDENRAVLETIPILHLTIRDAGLIERRLQRGLITIYTAERWFKPIRIFRSLGLFDCSVSGIVRMLVPAYWRMARRFAKFFTYSKFYFLPFGIHAASDMVRLCGLASGDLRCLFRAPRIVFDRVPCGTAASDAPNRYHTDRMRLWGYFVLPSTQSIDRRVKESNTLRILWLGRLIDWKRPKTVLRAVRDLRDCLVELSFIGEGTEKKRLEQQAESMHNVTFVPFLNKDVVREKMRDYDVLVMSSDAGEGWGAVTSEAIEEGLKVLGTYEAGASATLLPEDDLFHAGDWRALRKKLAECAHKKSTGGLRGQGIGEWSAIRAAHRLANWLMSVQNGEM